MKYFFARTVQTLREQGLPFFLKVILGKILGKNLEFVDFAFRKGAYYFRGSEIGLAMIRDSYTYMQLPDFSQKYNALVSGLDEESKKTVDLFIKHIHAFYYNNIVHESELFSERENYLQKKSTEFMGKYGVLHPTGYGLFENEDILRQIGNGSILDVGASDGIESIMFAKLLPNENQRKVYAFEPSSYNYSRLCLNIEKSPYTTTVIPKNIALGENDGEMEIFGSNGAEVSFINISGENMPKEKVKVLSLDSFVQQEGIQRVGLIKWDIEGTEIESIRGAYQTIIRDKPVLVVSIYHNGREFFETKPLIESWNIGYRFRVLQSEPGGTWVGIVLICY